MKIYIRRVGYLLPLFVMLFIKGFGQQIPSAYATGTKVNHIRAWNPVIPISSTVTVKGNSNIAEVRQTTQFYDGLGRPLQTVQKQYSPSGKDKVSAIVYDAYGREEQKFLPFISNIQAAGDVANDGNFKMNPFQQQTTFYNGYLAGQNQQYFYAKDTFESSPLNRVVSSYLPGDNWVGTQGQAAEANRHGKDIRYSVNTVNDNVRRWTVTNGTYGSFGTYSANAYAEAELTKLISEDEVGRQVVEFKDKAGKIVLKKVLVTAARDLGHGGGGHAGWLNTYYMYDSLDRLRCVLQPEGSREFMWTYAVGQINDSLLSEQTFRYEYDARDRMILKKVPGAGKVEMVYDMHDRMTMMRDSSLAKQGFWLVNKYDGHDRLIKIGLIANTFSRQRHEDSVNANVNYPVINNSDVLQENFYDDYSWITTPTPQAGISSTVNGADLTSTFFITSPNTDIAPEYARPLTPDYLNVRGKQTGSRVRVLGTGTYLHSVTFYDQDGRVLQQRGANITGGFDIFTTQYDYSGKVLRVMHRQQKGGVNTRFIRELTKFTYDQAGRLWTVTKKIGTGADKVIAIHEYDELGNLKKKTLGNGLESQEYEYNVQGWLLGANRNYVKGTATNKFGYDLGYDNPQSVAFNGAYTPQFNGNIGGMTWRSAGDAERRKYDFKYDVANRFMKAEFTQHTSGNVYDLSAGIDFTTVMGNGISADSAYDNNGNIRKMVQYGVKTGSSTMIDQLSYTYQANSNKLSKVDDLINDPNSKLGDFKNGTNSGDDYVYDGNGNLTKDRNKGIDNILYTHFNLPYEIRIPGKGKIVYTYDNGGTKWRKIVYDSTGTAPKTTTWTYMHNFVWRNDSLEMFSHEEGRVRCDVNQNTGEPVNNHFDYFLKDHLGNVRMVLTEEKDTAFYPMATIEDTARPQESLYYDIKTAQVRDVFPVTGDSTTQLAKKFYRVNGGVAGEKTGLGIVLKVMAGDTVSFRADSYYTTPGGTTANPDIPLTELLAAFAGSAAVAPHGMSVTDVTGISGNTNALDDLFNPTPNNSIVNAHLNWVLFDDQFKHVGGDVDGVSSSGNIKNHTKFINTPVIASKNGYLYIFVSNRSNLDVFFDNLVVTHYKGPILEETHYYPFGLTMAGISSSAMGKLDNKFRFNGYEQQSKEFSDGSGLEWYDYKNRFYNNQIGRFFCVDRLADKFPYYTPYQFAGNEVPNAIDLDGLEPLRYTKPEQMLQEGLGDLSKAAGKVVDKLSAFFSFSKETSDPSSAKGVSNVSTIEFKAGIATKTSGFLEYVESNGTAQGFKDDILNAGISFKTNSGVKTEISAGGASVSTTNFIDGTSKLKVEGPNPLVPFTTVSATNVTGTDGNTFKIEMGTPGPVKVKGGVEYNTKENKTSVTGGIEYKNGNTKTTVAVGISF